ncbi:TPA: transposase [Vibrio parahaemolyticus]|nr:transposase [Vibrio parahaemolyticus]
MRTGIPWRDFSSEFGKWSTIYMRFNLGQRKSFR